MPHSLDKSLLDWTKAGDKIPHSGDDKECGEHYISIDRDCHDGEANRPEPGKNPYWTGPNSPEERKKREVPWHETKPSAPPEKAREPAKPVREVRQLRPEHLGRSLERVKEAVGKLQSISLAMAFSARTFEKDGEEKYKLWNEIHDKVGAVRDEFEWGRVQDQEKLTEIVELLEPLTREPLDSASEALMQRRHTFPGSDFELYIAQVRNTFSRFKAAARETDPSDIIEWDALARKPESMKSVLDIPDLRLRGIGPEGPKNEAEEHWAKHRLRALQDAFEDWQANPQEKGSYLARQLLGTPYSITTTGNKTAVDETAWEPNPQAAWLILERSAKAGDEASNKLMWEEFGDSELWHPNSWIYDFDKALEHGKGLLNELGITDALRDVEEKRKRLRQLARADQRAVKEYYEQVEPLEYEGDRLDKLLAEEQISQEEYNKAVLPIAEAKDKLLEKRTEARRALTGHQQAFSIIYSGHRRNLLKRLEEANAKTRAPEETIARIVDRTVRPQWAEIDTTSPAYRGRAGKRLLQARQQARERSGDAMYTNRDTITYSVKHVCDITNAKLLGDPKLTTIKWQAEAQVRAHADDTQNAVTLKPDEDPSVAVHEFAHHLEFRNPELHERLLTFYDRRTKGSKVQNRRGYKKDEWFKDGKFFNKYCGKWYVPHRRGRGSARETAADPDKEGSKPGAATELASMGVQALFDGDMFRDLLMHDPEHLALIVASLRGN